MAAPQRNYQKEQELLLRRLEGRAGCPAAAPRLLRPLFQRRAGAAGPLLFPVHFIL